MGRSIYAQGTVDAVLFLAKKVSLRRGVSRGDTNWTDVFGILLGNLEAFLHTIAMSMSCKVRVSVVHNARAEKYAVRSSFNSERCAHFLSTSHQAFCGVLHIEFFTRVLQVREKADQRLYNMIDVLKEGDMR